MPGELGTDLAQCTQWGCVRGTEIWNPLSVPWALGWGPRFQVLTLSPGLRALALFFSRGKLLILLAEPDEMWIWEPYLDWPGLYWGRRWTGAQALVLAGASFIALSKKRTLSALLSSSMTWWQHWRSRLAGGAVMRCWVCKRCHEDCPPGMLAQLTWRCLFGSCKPSGHLRQTSSTLWASVLVSPHLFQEPG